MFDSKITIRALASSAAVRFASLAQACYLQEQAGTKTHAGFEAGQNDSMPDAVSLAPDLAAMGFGDQGEKLFAEEAPMSLHQRATLLGAIWHNLYSRANELADSKYELPLNLRQAYMLVVYGTTQVTRESLPDAVKAKVARAEEDARAQCEILLGEGYITDEEVPRIMNKARNDAIKEVVERGADFETIYQYISSFHVETELEDDIGLATLLNRLPGEEKHAWQVRALEKLLSEKEKTIDRLLSPRLPAKAKAELRAELPLLKADIAYLEQEVA